MLILRLVVAKPLCALFHDEPTRTGRRTCQDRVGTSDPAVADPLLQSADFVTDNLVAFHDALGRTLQSSQIAAGVRFGGAVGKEQPLFRDAGQPDLLLLRRGAE